MRRRSEARTAPGLSTHTKCPHRRPRRPTRREFAPPRPLKRPLASGSVSLGRSRQAPDPRQPRLEHRQLLEDRRHHLRRALARDSQLRHRWSPLRIREVRRPDEAHLFECQLVVGGASVVSASSSRARSRTSAGVRRRISSSNSGQRPSPTDPSGSTASAPNRRSGNAFATCRARCPPHESPTTQALSQPSASSTRRASSTSVATVYGPSAADGASPRYWYQATSFSRASSSARSRR